MLVLHKVFRRMRRVSMPYSTYNTSITCTELNYCMSISMKCSMNETSRRIDFGLDGKVFECRLNGGEEMEYGNGGS